MSLQNLYRTCERPYYHQGCWEGVPEPKVRYETMIAKAFNSDGDDFDIKVEYYVENESIVTITAYDKIVNMSDLEYDIREAIQTEESKKFKEINFAQN